MITINLKPGTKRAKAGGAALAGGLSSLKALTGKVKDPWLVGALGAWAVVIVVLGWLWVGTSASLSSLGPELDKARSENRRYRAFLAEKKHVEAARDSVLVQIATITQVDGDRYVWPHILDEVTRALPDYTWLTEMTTVSGAVPDSTAPGAPPVGVQMIGRTMDIQGFTRFMRQLEDSPWLKEVTVISTETVLERGRAVTAFTLRASYERRRPAAAAAARDTTARGN
jgi:Tfp pilus assembly protein PilN